LKNIIYDKKSYYHDSYYHYSEIFQLRGAEGEPLVRGPSVPVAKLEVEGKTMDLAQSIKIN